MGLFTGIILTEYYIARRNSDRDAERRIDRGHQPYVPSDHIRQLVNDTYELTGTDISPRAYPIERILDVTAWFNRIAGMISAAYIFFTTLSYLAPSLVQPYLEGFARTDATANLGFGYLFEYVSVAALLCVGIFTLMYFTVQSLHRVTLPPLQRALVRWAVRVEGRHAR